MNPIKSVSHHLAPPFDDDRLDEKAKSPIGHTEETHIHPAVNNVIVHKSLIPLSIVPQYQQHSDVPPLKNTLF